MRMRECLRPPDVVESTIVIIESRLRLRPSMAIIEIMPSIT